MLKVAFMGAGSTIFAKNILGDCLLSKILTDVTIALYDIDSDRLNESKKMLEALNSNLNNNRAKIESFLGIESRKKALEKANYVINAIQVGGYIPSTVIDFEIPKKFGLRQTIGDTIGIGGIFRALRTVPVCLDFAKEIEEVCPDAWFLNYVNPMAIVTGALLRFTRVKTVGLCHSVQVCAENLLKKVGLLENIKKLQWKIAGINHQAWLLEITEAGKDLYPEIKKRAFKMNEESRNKNNPKHDDMVRFEIMKHFGYYVTESSEHSAEYMPYWIKNKYPELIDELNIPLDEYPRRCEAQINEWKHLGNSLSENPELSHSRTNEYGAGIIEAIESDIPYHIGANILNNGLITNLPNEAVVEVPCLVDRNGVLGCYVGKLPEQLVALNRTNVNVQLLTLEAVQTKKKESIYHAAMLDPHTSSELKIDEIIRMCDEMLEAHNLNNDYK